MTPINLTSTQVALLSAFAFWAVPMAFSVHAEKDDSLDMMSIALNEPATVQGKLGTVTPVTKGNKTVGFKFEFSESNDYPSLSIPTPRKGWDLTPFVAIVAEIENVGNDVILPALAIANMGVEGNNQNGVNLVPGQTGFIRLEIGFSWGNEDKKLDLKTIDTVHLFVGPGKKGAFVVKSISAVKR